MLLLRGVRAAGVRCGGAVMFSRWIIDQIQAAPLREMELADTQRLPVVIDWPETLPHIQHTPTNWCRPSTEMDTQRLRTIEEE